MFIKKERLISEILKSLNLIFQRNFIHDEYLNTVSVHEVKLSQDKKIATIYFSYYDVSKNLAIIEYRLVKKQKTIRMLLAKKIKIANVPDLVFKYDKTLDNANRIEQILKMIE